MISYHAMALEIETIIKTYLPITYHCTADEIRKDPCKIIVDVLTSFETLISVSTKNDLDEYIEWCNCFAGEKLDDIAKNENVDFKKQIILKFKKYCENIKAHKAITDYIGDEK